MITLSPFDVYKMYLAFKLHFTTDNYDAIAMKGRVRASQNAFARRRDLTSIRKISEKLSEKEVADFLVANFVSGDKWGGLFDAEAREVYTEWMRRNQRLTYQFEQDVDALFIEAVESQTDFKDIFRSRDGNHPLVIKSYIRKTISIETVVILDRFVKYMDKLNESISEKFLFPEVYRITKKYKPFLHYDEERMYGILRSKYDEYFGTGTTS